MTYRLRIRARAERDLIKAQQWYEGQRPGLGGEFRAAVDEILVHLPTQPLIYPLVRDRAHRAVVPRFPYLVYFLIVGDLVSVIACFHGHQDQNRLRSRLR